ncbi:MAG: prolipoprotein diacylglyceryl transferase [Microscillaceae bacterium]|jgi:prolipoprotein diacylglyceryl transferase|nr:prolipoprotein diacylglyceryl transferase [Microscillaceae bacterium]
MLNFLNYIIWSANPEIFSLGFVHIRWYGLLFALGFLLGQWIFTKIFKWEGKPEKDLEILLVYMVVSTVVGARLGHCLFYQPDYYLSNPIEILKVWEGGLASHGAAIGIILALYLYARGRVGQSFFWVADRIVIVVALGGALIRLGNLMNSEIIGKPDNSALAFVFTNSMTETLQSYKDIKVERVSYTRGIRKDTTVNGTTYVPLKMTVEFKKSEIKSEDAQLFLRSNLPFLLTPPEDKKKDIPEIQKHFKLFNPQTAISVNQSDKNHLLTLDIYGIPRHPTQLYEALWCVLMFVGLFMLYYQRKGETPEGQLFGWFLIVLFSFRFFVEYFKENQVDFEATLPLNMGQILSIPAILVGIIALVIVARQKKS